MIKLTRSGSGGQTSLYMYNEVDTLVKIYPNCLNSATIGVYNTATFGAISPAFRDSDGSPLGLSFSINGDYYELRFSELMINGNNYSGFTDTATALDNFFTSQPS